jgi:hypothetical protein
VQSSITVANFTRLDEFIDVSISVGSIVADSGAEAETMLIAALERSRAIYATGQNDLARGVAIPRLVLARCSRIRRLECLCTRGLLFRRP